MLSRMGSAGLVAAAALASCSSPQENSEAAAPAAPVDVANTSGVVREEVAAPAATPAPAEVAVLQSQPGPKGNTVALNRVAVTGDILTVSLTFSGGSDCCVHIPVDDVSVIDDATSQRISVLKDNQGKWMAAPLEGGGTNVSPESYKTPSILWFKFPAPPVTSKTVSITLPGVAPFDAVPVTR